MLFTMGKVEHLLAAVTAVEHIMQDKVLDKDNECNIVKKMDDHGGAVNNMEGGEHVAHIRGKCYDDTAANAANTYNAKDKYCGNAKDIDAAATNYNNEEIVKCASKRSNLPPLGNQFMTMRADEHGAPPLYVLYIEPICGFNCEFEVDE